MPKKSQNVSIPLHLKRSATLYINEQCNALEKEGRKIYRMGLGQSPFPVPEVVVDSLKQHANKKKYLPVKGLPELRNTVAEFHQRMDGLDFKSENIMIGPGSKELIFLLQSVLDWDIILPTPCWVSYAPQAEILGNQIHFIHTRFENGWRLTPNLLTEFLDRNILNQNKLIILNYPGNPDGSTYSNDELKDIAEIFRKNKITVLSDEIYGLINHNGIHSSIAKYYPKGTIVSSGLSKWCGAGGWRLGTMSFPEELSWILEPMAMIASETYTSVCAPIQYAAITAFLGGSIIDDYLFHLRRILKTIGTKCFELFNENSINVIAPKGGFYLFPVFNEFQNTLISHGIITSEDFCNDLLEVTGVASLPGSDFNRKHTELSCRLAYVNFDGTEALKISESIGKSPDLTIDDLTAVCGDVLVGINKLIEFVRIHKS